MKVGTNSPVQGTERSRNGERQIQASLIYGHIRRAGRSDFSALGKDLMKCVRIDEHGQCVLDFFHLLGNDVRLLSQLPPGAWSALARYAEATAGRPVDQLRLSCDMWLGEQWLTDALRHLMPRVIAYDARVPPGPEIQMQVQEVLPAVQWQQIVLQPSEPAHPSPAEAPGASAAAAVPFLPNEQLSGRQERQSRRLQRALHDAVDSGQPELARKAVRDILAAGFHPYYTTLTLVAFEPAPVADDAEQHINAMLQVGMPIMQERLSHWTRCHAHPDRLTACLGAVFREILDSPLEVAYVKLICEQPASISDLRNFLQVSRDRQSPALYEFVSAVMKCNRTDAEKAEIFVALRGSTQARPAVDA